MSSEAKTPVRVSRVASLALFTSIALTVYSASHHHLRDPSLFRAELRTIQHAACPAATQHAHLRGVSVIVKHTRPPGVSLAT